MDKTLKANYIALIQKIDIDQAIKDPLIDFIDTYDGTNIDDFKVFVMTTVLLLSKYSEIEVKAEAYDALADNNADYHDQLDALKSEYEDFKSGKAPSSKPHINQ